MKRLILFFIYAFFILTAVSAQNDSVLRVDTTVHHSIQPVVPKHVVIPKPVIQHVNAKEVPPVLIDSILIPHENENAVYNIQKVRPAERNYLLPVLMLIMLCYLTWIRFQYPKELNENITVIVNANLGQQIYRDREYSLNIFTTLTFINFAVLTGLFIYIVAVHYHLELPFDNNFFNVLLCIVLVFAAYIAKSILYRIAGYLYHLDGEFSVFRFNSLVIYQLGGIVLLPFVILAATAQEPVAGWAIAANFVVLAIILILRLFKGLQIAGSYIRFRFVYFFLYLCAFEFAPVLILYKLFTTQF